MNRNSNSFYCDVCGDDSAHFFKKEKLLGIDKTEYDLVQCDNCGMISIRPLPSADFLNRFYSQYRGKCKKGIIESDPLNTNRSVVEDSFVKLKYIEKTGDINHRGRLLDIGCGHGFFVYAAQAWGYEALGVDIDSKAIQFGRSHMGVNLCEMSIDSLSLSETSIL